MSEPGPSKQSAQPARPSKRSATQLEESADGPMDAGASKIAKIHPFFSKPSAPSAFQWLKPALGPKRTCLHGTHLDPPARSKVALFDLDGTLIKWTGFKPRGKSADPSKWAWWRPSVPAKLKALHQEGYAIVWVSNQALRAGALEDWKKKIPLIANALPDVPFRLFAASAKDGYRKPMPGMWYELERIFKEQNVDIDKETTFFVGDAAGRPDDFASTDRKWAINVGIPFHTPEEYFLGLPKAPYKLPGFHVSSLPQTTDLLSPPTANIVPASSQKMELVLLTGFPCLGKSSFYRRHFAGVGYVHVNQDTLGTRPRCVKAAEEALKAGKSCVIDNTNRDTVTRKHYVDLAKKAGARVRCFLFEGSIDLAWHNNLYRAYNQPPSNDKQPVREILPYLAFISFRDAYEEPKASEGFSEVVRVNWVFEGDEEAKRRWNMWLQIDGK